MAVYRVTIESIDHPEQLARTVDVEAASTEEALAEAQTTIAQEDEKNEAEWKALHERLTKKDTDRHQPEDTEP